MTSREQILHLLRRFSFGPARSEVSRFEQAGVDATIAHLIDYEKVDEGFHISPWEICFEPNLPDMYVDPQRMGLWWSIRMLLTQRPLQENLTLFWHNHLAISGTKVEFGPAMIEYIDVLRSNAIGHFPTMVEEVSRTPAMLRWLDIDASVIGQPNENFARELMELFTIGIGNYAEADVKEAARAFTGWSLRYYIYEAGGENVQARLKEAVKLGIPMIAASFAPGLCDTGMKTILGRSGKFSASDVIAYTATRPETASRLAKKLWEWYAYPDPDAKIVDKLARAFQASDFQIKPVMKEIVAMPEFWSPKCIRQKVKSPAEFIIGPIRQLELNAFLEGLRPATTTQTTPLPPILRATGGLLWGSMTQQGLQLLFPPDVSGWRWGNAWLTSANMAERMKFAATIFGVGQSDKGLANYIGNKIKTDFKPTKPDDVVDGFCQMFDAEFTAGKRNILIKACTEAGGVDALGTPEGSSKVGHAVCRLMFTSPEFQMC
ncbi:MAG TPA: DUF1800 domain-containing protein [Fimbriimonadaceae bacterium]|nr:DUF1800 domain-containing protein [Fimbriimonadaceae bacterium]